MRRMMVGRECGRGKGYVMGVLNLNGDLVKLFSV